MTTSYSFDLTRLAKNAAFLTHWVWVDGMSWMLPDPHDAAIPLLSGVIGTNKPIDGAVPDLTCEKTVELLADRVRYLYELPDLECVFENHLNLYKVYLPSGVAVARYSPAGCWVGLLELWSYRTEMKKIGRSV